MGRGRHIAFHAAMWSLTVCVCVLLAGLYFAYRGAQLPRVGARLTGDWLMERDDEIGFVPPRHGATEIEYGGGFRWHVFTDGRGARVNARGEETADRVDVMTVGCSFTWGASVESEETYPQQLGRILDVPVANFAMGSYGSVQAFQTIVRHADLAPKVVVYGFIQDHLRRNVSPCAPNTVPYCLPVSYLERQGDWVVLQPPHMEYFSPEDNRAFATEVALRPLDGPAAWLLGAKWAAKIALFRYRTSDTIAVDTSPETARLAMAAIIRGMLDATQKIGARLVVLNMPYLPRGRVQAAPDALTNAIAGKDVTFVDFAPVAAAYYDGNSTGTLILGDDPHPNAVAHRLIAETLAPVIRPLVAQRGASVSASQ
jgi:hypothetical protein